jgi:hypothetical protein
MTLLGRFKLTIDTLFMGIGQISHDLAIDFSKQGQRIIVCTDNEKYLKNSASLVQKKNQIEYIDRKHIQKLRIASESLYISWRKMPVSIAKDPEITNWLESGNFTVNRIFHLSSASVYPSIFRAAKEEDFLPSSSNQLNAKQNLEQYFLMLANLKSAGLCNFRISNVYGGNIEHGFINESLSRVRTNLPLRVFDSLDLVRDYLFKDDLIDVLTRLHGIKNLPMYLNVSTGIESSISMIVDLIKSKFDTQIEYIRSDEIDHPIPYSVLNCDLLRKQISWEPKILIEVLPVLLATFRPDCRVTFL